LSFNPYFITRIEITIKFYRFKKASKVILMPEKVKVEVDATIMNYCPKCGSKQTYLRINTNEIVCRSCGKISKWVA
jgi:ribosomal protein L37AE/L43A